MTDVAYSAVFLHDREMANQVSLLYKKINALYLESKKAIEKAKIKKDEKSYINKFILYIKDLATSAAFIADLTLEEQVPEFITHTLQNADKRVIEELIHYSSFFANKTIGELKIRTYTKARIIAIKRNEKWLFDISKDTRLMPKDTIIAIGTAQSERLLKESVRKSSLFK